MRGGKGLLTRCGCHSYRCRACASGLFLLMQRNNKADRKTERRAYRRRRCDGGEGRVDATGAVTLALARAAPGRRSRPRLWPGAPVSSLIPHSSILLLLQGGSEHASHG